MESLFGIIARDELKCVESLTEVEHMSSVLHDTRHHFARTNQI